ncbi:MAG: ABC transporter substrate-binding protein [Chloroflexota bacterium]|nr:ABC transporter substrate-binding protein [Chloroflexota bacterium]
MSELKSHMVWASALIAVALPTLAACGGADATATSIPVPATNTTTTAAATTAPTTGAAMSDTPTAAMAATPGTGGAMMGLDGLTAEGIKADPAAKGKFEFFSWWTAGGEAEGKNDILNLYKQLYPGVNTVDAAVAGGGGDKAKSVLKTRMEGNDPPDTFQVHGGPELLSGYVAPGRMQPVTQVYKDMNMMSAFPKQLLDLVSQGGEIYAVPANIHRGNELFYNKKVVSDAGITAAPTTLDELYKDCDMLKAKNIPCLAVGGKDTWSVTMLFEDLLLNTAGADKYNSLMKGQTDWTDKSVVDALNDLKKIWSSGYVNKDFAALTWDDAVGQVINGKAAMTVMGDWAKGNLQSKSKTWDQDFGWEPTPGTAGIFKVIVDTFGLPVGAKNADNTKHFLALLGSKTGQVTFNLRKGSIPARTDVDTSKFDSYMKDAAKDFASAKSLVGSAPHGSATIDAFASQLTTAINSFISSLGDPAATAKDIQSQASDLLKK